MIRFWIKLGIMEYLVGSSICGTRALAMLIQLFYPPRSLQRSPTDTDL